jgi:hypothetical protein
MEVALQTCQKGSNTPLKLRASSGCRDYCETCQAHVQGIWSGPLAVYTCKQPAPACVTHCQHIEHCRVRVVQVIGWMRNKGLLGLFVHTDKAAPVHGWWPHRISSAVSFTSALTFTPYTYMCAHTHARTHTNTQTLHSARPQVHATPPTCEQPAACVRQVCVTHCWLTVCIRLSDV